MTKQQVAPGAVHRMPADFGQAIASDPAVKSLWAQITSLARNEWI